MTHNHMLISKKEVPHVGESWDQSENTGGKSDQPLLVKRQQWEILHLGSTPSNQNCKSIEQMRIKRVPDNDGIQEEIRPCMS